MPKQPTLESATVLPLPASRLARQLSGDTLASTAIEH